MFDPYEDPEDFPEAGRRPNINPMEHAKNTIEVPIALHDPRPIVDAKGNHPEAEWASAMEPDIHESDPDYKMSVPAATKEDKKAPRTSGGFFGGNIHMPHFRHPHLPGHHVHIDEATSTGDLGDKPAPVNREGILSHLDRGLTDTPSEDGHTGASFLAGFRRRSSELVHLLTLEHARYKNELTGVWPEYEGNVAPKGSQGRD
ncbi:hypothetical protein B0A48_18672 [Cryoendolithus antarcticus]|uniref:Uncharacterized protein n=1 Tax=Cryoendolithus antarcticus TaxID=1507870 RepID=A0A1V8S864_9PEZI|nr:hypothetical protein B0A48_18672 [Cryoendolithus antarcticus]